MPRSVKNMEETIKMKKEDVIDKLTTKELDVEVGREDVLLRTASGWMRRPARIIPSPPPDEYLRLDETRLPTLLEYMAETDKMFAAGTIWAELKCKRLDVPCALVRISGDSITRGISSPADNVQLMSDFQDLLEAARWSFDNQLQTREQVLQVAGESSEELVRRVRQVQSYVQLEATTWQEITQEAIRVGAGEGDSVYQWFRREALRRSVMLNVQPLRRKGARDTWQEMERALNATLTEGANFYRGTDRKPSLGSTDSTATPYAGWHPTSHRNEDRVYMAVTAADSPLGRDPNQQRLPSTEEEEEEKEGGSEDYGTEAGIPPRRSSARGNPGGRPPTPTLGIPAGYQQQVIPMVSPGLMGIQPLTYFTGEDSKRDNREWLERFQFVAESSLWDFDRRRRTLLHYCKDGARAWADCLSRASKETWATLLAEFKKEFCVDERSHLRRYSSAKQHEKESALTFFRRLTHLAKQAKIPLKSGASMNQHMDTFYEGLHDRSIWREFRWKEFDDVTEAERMLKRADAILRSGRRLKDEPNGRTSTSRDSSSLSRTRTNSPHAEKIRGGKKNAQVYRAELADYESYSDSSGIDDAGESQDEREWDEDVFLTQAPQNKGDRVADRERRLKGTVSRTGLKCPVCQRPGHEAANCWAKMVCSACQGTGHPKEFCYRKCTFCDQVHENRGPCPMKRPVTELLQWVKAGGEKTGQPMPKVPDQLLNC